MTTPKSEQHELTDVQEARWFAVWVAAMLAFFVIAGTWLTWSQASAKARAQREHAAWMDPDAPDPGVTAAEPGSIEHATPVHVGIYLEGITDLSVRDTSWTAVFNLWLRWDGDLPSPAKRLVFMEGRVERFDEIEVKQIGETHYERYGVTVRFMKLFRVQRFPLDEHLLVIAIEDGAHLREELVFVPDHANDEVSSRVAVPGHRIVEWRAIEKAHSYKTTRGEPGLVPGTKTTHSQMRFGVLLAREGWGIYWKMFQALFVAVAIAFLPFFIKPTDVDPRFGLGVGALFAAVANAYLIGSFVPDTGEFALADIVNALGIMTILVTLIESTVSLYLWDRRGEEKLSRKLDRVSFIVVAGGYVTVNLALLIAAGA